MKYSIIASERCSAVYARRVPMLDQRPPIDTLLSVKRLLEYGLRRRLATVLLRYIEQLRASGFAPLQSLG